MSRKSKKKYPLVATVSGMLQKAKRKHQNYAQSLSDPEQSENEWSISEGRSPSIAQSEDEEGDLFQDTESLFAKVPSKKTEETWDENEQQNFQNLQQQFQQQQQHYEEQRQEHIKQQQQFQEQQQQFQEQQMHFEQQQQQFQQQQFQQQQFQHQQQQQQQAQNQQQQQHLQHQMQFEQMQHQFQQEQLQPEHHQIQPPNQLNISESNFTTEDEVSGKSTGSGTSSTAIFATVGEVSSKRSGSEKSDDSTSSEPKGSFQPMIGGASMEFAVSRALGKYRRRQSNSMSDEQSEERPDDEPQPLPEPPKSPIIIKTNSIDSTTSRLQHEDSLNLPQENSPSASSMRMNRFFPKHQQSLEIPRDEEDTRSIHSWRSGSRVSSRRQSTEDSIDSEDEWYCYELRKLEEMERQKELEAEMGETLREEPEEEIYEPKEEIKEKMNFVLRELKMKVRPKEGVITEKEMNHQTAVAARRRESGPHALDLFAKVTAYHHWKDKSPEEAPPTVAALIPPVIEDREDRSAGSGDTSGPDSPDQSVDELDDDDHQPEQSKARVNSLRLQDPLNESEPQDIPQIQIETEESPKNEDDGKESGPMGSKWKLLKALKERKAEEKSNNQKVTDTSTPPAVEKDKVSGMLSMVQKFYEIHVKT